LAELIILFDGQINDDLARELYILESCVLLGAGSSSPYVSFDTQLFGVVAVCDGCLLDIHCGVTTFLLALSGVGACTREWARSS